jgi:type IV pilus biogenesis protein CpaD/CtpE
MAAVRLPLLVGTALIAIAGCAGQPRQTGSNPPAQTASGAPVVSAAGTKKPLVVPGLTAHLLAQARDDGYKPRMVDGQFRFCRVEIPVGSNLPVRQCVNTTQLRFELLNEQATRQNLEEQAPMGCQPGVAC